MNLIQSNSGENEVLNINVILNTQPSPTNNEEQQRYSEFEGEVH